MTRNFAREYVYRYLENHPCTQCGEPDPVVLEFQHVEEKDMDVATMVAGGYSIERIHAELDKCVFLCANRHRTVTHAERG